MAKAFKCDRCGALYDEKQRTNSELYVGKIDPLYSFKTKDLCPTCQSLFEAWWSEGYNCKHAAIDIYKTKTILYSIDEYQDMAYNTAECPNCGYKYEEGDKDWGKSFCPHCGQALKWESEG